MPPRVRGPSCSPSIAYHARLRKAQSSGGVAFDCASGNHLEVTAKKKSPERAAALKAIGKRVQIARGEMTRAALARHLGFADQSSITRVEAGLQGLDLLPLIAAARIFRCSTDWILTGKGDPPPLESPSLEDQDQRRRQA